MYKNIALIALLLPFSGYAITKQERQKEIVRESREIGARIQWLEDVVKNNYLVFFVYGDFFSEEARRLYAKAVALEEEFKKIALELSEEQSCTNA